ncbi:unnamed protein product [Thelazia callipaeda]|uniref:LITAF domain-containing protein n=1 Tax=Thelazia callipaeda TaxID=103827 RepID=A0A0N5D8A7_THECL|nr:unnamed protein product [Thelazia callipaeda]
MIDGNHFLPKYEEAVKNDNSDPNAPVVTTTSSPSLSPSSASIIKTSEVTNGCITATNTRPFNVNVISTTAPIFGPNPVETDCLFCQAHIVTSTQKVIGTLPWIIMGICFLLGFFVLIPWCLCCIPFCMDNYRDVVHTCPCCKRSLGRFTKL